MSDLLEMTLAPSLEIYRSINYVGKREERMPGSCLETVPRPSGQIACAHQNHKLISIEFTPGFL